MTIKTKDKEIYIPKWVMFVAFSAIAGVFESVARIAESRVKK